MAYLVLGLLLFLGVHSVRMLVPKWREQMLVRLGEKGWKGLYSVVSAAGFVLLVYGFSLARLQTVVLWVPPLGMRHAASLLMLLAWILLAAAYVPGNGFKARLHHPMVLGVKTWALAHLLANGSLHGLLLFGGFLVWAVLCFVALRRRDRAAGTVYAAGKTIPTVVAVVIGVALYTLFAFHLHQPLIGKSVF